MRTLLRSLERAAFHPETLPPDLVLAIAIAPPVLAGVLLFRSTAIEVLLLALAVGTLAHVGARTVGLPLRVSPALTAVVAVALVGPGAPIGWILAVAVMAASLELLRARFLPGARVEVAFLAYTALFFLGQGILAHYTAPGSAAPAAEPIRLWLTYFGDWRAPIDPVQLYVGNVPGPLFATSLLAVAVGAAWFWYARRMSLFVMVAFVVGAIVPMAYYRWSPGFQLISGPLWFAVALFLADRRRLPGNPVGRVLVGLAAGLAVIGSRQRGFSIETAFVTVAALQAVTAALAGLAWLYTNRRRTAAAPSGLPAERSTRLARRAG